MVDHLIKPGARPAINDQMHPRRRVTVIHTVPTGKVEKPAFARLHGHALTVEPEVDMRRTEQWNVQAPIGVGAIEVIIAMLVNLSDRKSVV